MEIEITRGLADTGTPPDSVMKMHMPCIEPNQQPSQTETQSLTGCMVACRRFGGVMASPFWLTDKRKIKQTWKLHLKI